MLLLAADTSGKQGSIALAECGPERACNVLEVVALEGGTFSAQLVPQISGLLKKYHFTRHDIGAFAAASGPGSFTGLRIGLAAIKALAEVLQKPIATVSLLEAVAVAANARGKLVAALDAGRGEMYCGQYEVGEKTRMISEQLLSGEELIADAHSLKVITPDSRIADFAKSHNLSVELIPHPDSGSIARLGWGKLLAGQAVSPEMLDANYIRRTDAEISSRLKI